jgi:glycosyltransferase involved in cell wall biosynthesis
VLREHCERSGGGLWYADGDELAAGLDMLLDDPGLRDRIAAAGRAYTRETFSWPAVRRRFFDALEAWS